jgi:hypothetical protein
MHRVVDDPTRGGDPMTDPKRPGEDENDAGDLLGTPPPATRAGDQNAGAETGADPADPDEAED